MHEQVYAFLFDGQMNGAICFTILECYWFHVPFLSAEYYTYIGSIVNPVLKSKSKVSLLSSDLNHSLLP